MEGSGKMISMKDLPAEILTDILSRLPVKTLIRFSSVRKAWYAMIRNPSFVAKHLHRQSAISYLLVIPEEPFGGTSCSILRDDDSFSKHATLDFPLDTDTKTAEIVGSCYGLVCVSDHDVFVYARRAYLWNPSTRSCKTLPPSRFGKRLSDWRTSFAVIGFGYCESADDFRVVRVAYFADDSGTFVGKVKPEVEVYSLKTGSWKKHAVVVPRTAHSASVAFAKGAVHWLASLEPFSAFDVILAFDLKDEAFREMMLPKRLLKSVGELSDSNSLRIKEFGESVALFVYRIRAEERCHVFLMNEYADSKSWTKLFNIVPQESIERLLGYTKSGKIILENSDEKLVAYDPGRKKFSDLGFHGPYGAQATFTESLVLLEHVKVPFCESKAEGSVGQPVSA